MTDNDIIEWKITSLVNSNKMLNENEVPEDIQAYLFQRPELSKELDFIEQFWQYDTAVLENPSAQMDANFYQMLSKAQSVNNIEKPLKNEINEGVASNNKGILGLITKVLSPQPLAQFAMLGLVFVIGFNVNQPTPTDIDFKGLTSLQEEVSSLNTMLAISLLDKASASERLSGVAYSRSSDLSNPVLQEKLIALIQSDKSTSVRLAVINRLHGIKSIDLYSEQLLLLFTKESNVLVQIALCQLLLSTGSSETIGQLNNLLKTNDLNPEVREIIKANTTRSFT
jgi:hypothetical protein